MLTASKWCVNSVIILTVLFTLLFAQGMACSSAKTISAPPPITLQQAPEEVTALSLWKEFQASETNAMAKYEGKTLHFARVIVDKMSYLGEGMDTELYVQEGIEPGIEMVKFRTDLLSDILNVRDRYIVEIVGKVQGMQFGYLVVRISWLKVIDPPGGDTKPPAEY